MYCKVKRDLRYLLFAKGHHTVDNTSTEYHTTAKNAAHAGTQNNCWQCESVDKKIILLMNLVKYFIQRFKKRGCLEIAEFVPTPILMKFCVNGQTLRTGILYM